MELRPGYKQTEVGAIPEGWTVKRLRELLRQGPKNGLSARCGENACGTPTLSLAATSKGYMVLNDTTIKCLEQEIPQDSPLFLESGDVLVQRSNTADLVGTTAVFEGAAKTFVYPDLMMRLRFKRPITGYWFWRYANSGHGRSFFRKAAAGSTGSMPKISGETLREMPVPAPPFSEQQAVSDLLSDTDALIESLEQLLAKKRQIRQGATQDLLTGAKRLPGFGSGHKTKLMEAGTIPADWCAEDIGGLARITTGARNTQDHVEDGEYPFFVRSNVVERINTYSYDGEAVLTAGDGVGTGKVFHYIKGKFDVHQRVYRISDFHESINGYFFYLYFSTHFYNRIMQMTAKSSVDSVRRDMIAKMVVPFPPTMEEQRAIVEAIHGMADEISLLEQKLAKARQLKQGMMQELLTGRIRLVQPAAQVVTLPKKASANIISASGHNPQINEAIVIAVLTHRFGTERFPLGRFRRTKLSYLLHRHCEGSTAGFQKKAAGPYNPDIRYGGAEKIALKNGYVRAHKTGKAEGFLAGENITQAQQYFEKWYGPETLSWLEQFHYKSNDDLELLTTVDMAAEELRSDGRSVDVPTVKRIIRQNPEWKPKLNRQTFSDRNIASAIDFSRKLFPVEEVPA